MALDLKNPVQPPPPVKRGPGRPKKPAVETPKESRVDSRAAALDGLWGIVSVGLLMLGQVPDAAAVATHSPGISLEAARLAEDNESIAKIVDFVAGVGPYAALMTATLPLLLQIGVNHGKVPMVPMLHQMGIKPPAILEAEMRAKAAQQLAEMERDFAAQAAANGNHAA